ncbi:hypothetical protein [Anabaena sp. CCY 0017]|uniref:hypothetical protein n=1 Tax=Anabaena sp. CCY 0017 TaxID=3103866 RepID=UPI0039C6E3A2
MIATDADWKEVRQQLLNEWGGLIHTVYDTAQLQHIHTQIPSSWLRVVDTPCTTLINEIWSEAKSVLPRFMEYLNQSTWAIAIADGLLGPTLIYYIKDWEETQIGQYEPGFMLAGLPTPVERIRAFEQSMGRIPASLQKLWQVHGFVLIKSGAILSSLDHSLEEFCGSPTVLGLRKAPSDPQEQYECLAIADVRSELPVCLTRTPGFSVWEDFIVLADRDGEEVAPAVRTRIDDLLTDWTFSEWTP